MEIANVIIYVDREARYTVGEAGPTAPKFSRRLSNIVRRVVRLRRIKLGRYNRPLMVGKFTDPAHTAALAATLKRRFPHIEIITQ